MSVMTQERKPRADGHASSSGQSVGEKGAAVSLMRRMGVQGHPFDPMPPDQHRWQRRKGQPELHRLWSWMVGNTAAFGHRCEYAVSDSGHELHIENAAKDLGMDLPNVYRAWRNGVEMGIFRGGTRREGERKMYFCGSVKPEPAPNSGSEDQENCLYKLFPSHIRKQIKDWPKERVEKLWSAIANKDAVEREAMAVYVAAIRAHIIQEKDTVYQTYGVKLNQQAHVKNGESPEETEARRARVEPLLPGIAKFVQTIEDSVQSDETALYSDSVHSDSARASLLHQSNSRTTPERSSSSPDSARNGEPGNPSQDGDKHGVRLAEFYDPEMAGFSGNGLKTKTTATRKDDRPLLEILHKSLPAFAKTDDHSLRSLALLCVNFQPECTVIEVAEAIADKATAARAAKHPFPYLKTSVVELFKPGVAFDEWRLALRNRLELEASEIDRRLLRDVEMAHRLLADKHVEPEDRQWAEEVLQKFEEKRAAAGVSS
jgi:hypothetical protein